MSAPLYAIYTAEYARITEKEDSIALDEVLNFVRVEILMFRGMLGIPMTDIMREEERNLFIAWLQAQKPISQRTPLPHDTAYSITRSELARAIHNTGGKVNTSTLDAITDDLESRLWPTVVEVIKEHLEGGNNLQSM